MKIKNLRWVVLSLIALVTIINYLDRGTLNYMFLVGQSHEFVVADAPVEGEYTVCLTSNDTYTFYDRNGEVACTAAVSDPAMVVASNNTITYKVNAGIAHDLGLVDPNLTVGEQDEQGKSVLSIITIFFMIAYGISQLVSGKIYDKIGTRKGFTLSAIIWGAADACTAFASGKPSLIAFRMALGLGEAGPWPGTVKSNAEWFPTKERALAQGIFGAAASVGSILAPIIIPLLFIAFGWRVAFIVVGCLGILWVLPWLFINKKAPKEHPWITDEERTYILEGQPVADACADAAKPAGKSWGQLLRDPRNYSLILGRLFLDPIWWMFVTWLPIYLKQVFDLDIKQIASSAWVPYVGAAAGSIIGGWFSGRLIRAGKSINFARKTAMVVGGVIIIPAMVLAAQATSATTAVICMAFVLGGFQFAMVNMQTLASDLHSGKTVGSLAGLGGVSAVLGTLIGMVLVPMITSGANWTLFFVMCGALVPLSLLAVFLCVKKIEPIED
ncbi:MAG: MFS transporter [Rikenellaceae bacterium]